MAINKKFYIFGGCSFVDMPNSWARQIQTDLIKDYDKAKNTAKSGAGNDFISTSALHTALQAEQNGFRPDITIMWSHPSRYEIPLDMNSPYVDKLFDENIKQKNDFNPGIFYEDHRGEIDRSRQDNFWLLQCSKVTSKTKWSNDPKVNKAYIETFENFQKYLWNLNYQWYNTLRAILLVQNICESKGWEYRFTVFRSYVREFKKYCSPQFQMYQDCVKWDKFIFTDDTDGGLREYTLNTVNTWDDGFDMHPSKEAHEKFVYDFWLPKFPGVYC